MVSDELVREGRAGHRREQEHRQGHRARGGRERRGDLPDRALGRGRARAAREPGPHRGEIEARGGTAIAVACDHTDDAQVEAVFDRIRAEQGRLDLVVNVASPDFSEMVGVSFWDLPFKHIAACLDIGPRSELRDHRAGGADDDRAALRGGDQHLVARCRELPALGALRRRQGRDRQGHPRHRVRAAAARRRRGVAVARPGAHRRPARQHRRSPTTGDASCTASTSASGRRRSSTAWPWSRWRPTPTSSSAPAARSGRRRWPGSTASPRTTGTSPRRWPTASSPRMGDDMPDYWRGVERAVPSDPS